MMMLKVVLAAALIGILACRAQRRDPADARAALEKRRLDYNAATFVANVKEGKAEIVNLFLDAGMDPDIRGDSEPTALMICAERNNAAVLKILLAKGASVELAASEGQRALHYAATATNGGDCVRLLLEHHADANAKTSRGNTPLMSAVLIPSAEPSLPDAAMFKLIDKVRILLEHGADVNAANIDGVTPLMRAAVLGNTEFLRELLEHGADVHAIDRRGESAASYAVRYNNAQAALLLQRREAKERKGTPY
ncbi:MAG TPA: ankyrin repeat domain-containing protein [Blastocatellia bacterium]|nr:ankyrin repeat domain-containing protein [Blastocatellia bacterium]